MTVDSQGSAQLFRASCIALIATAMSFAIRGDIMGDFESGVRADARPRSAGLPVRRSGDSDSRFCSAGRSSISLGMSTLARLAAVGAHRRHADRRSSRQVSRCLFAATLVIGIANGLVEAFVNPLVATLYRREKTSKLVALHAWFPGGIVIGGLLRVRIHAARSGLAGQDAAAARAVGHLYLVVPGKDVPPNRERRRGSVARRDVR